MRVFEFAEPDGRVLIVEDDSRVAYAYLLEGSKIASDVWLYNHPGAVATWSKDAPQPFANKPRYYSALPTPLSDRDTVQVVWHKRGAEVLVNGVVWAVLTPETRPGWSRFAIADGPAAKRLLNGDRRQDPLAVEPGEPAV